MSFTEPPPKKRLRQTKSLDKQRFKEEQLENVFRRDASTYVLIFELRINRSNAKG